MDPTKAAEALASGNVQMVLAIGLVAVVLALVAVIRGYLGLQTRLFDQLPQVRDALNGNTKALEAMERRMDK